MYSQTNEVSTPFLYLNRKLGQQWALPVFALLFFGCRVGLNCTVIYWIFHEPRMFTPPYGTLLVGASVLYEVVQLFWAFKIVRLLVRKASGSVKEGKGKEE